MVPRGRNYASVWRLVGVLSDNDVAPAFHREHPSMHGIVGGIKLRRDRVHGPQVSVMPRVRNRIPFAT